MAIAVKKGVTIRPFGPKTALPEGTIVTKEQKEFLIARKVAKQTDFANVKDPGEQTDTETETNKQE